MATAEQLKNARSAHLGNLTKLYKLSADLMKQPDQASQASEHLRKIEEQRQRLLTAHEAVVVKLKAAEEDASVIATLDQQLNECDVECKRHMTAIENWLDSVELKKDIAAHHDAPDVKAESDAVAPRSTQRELSIKLQMLARQQEEMEAKHHLERQREELNRQAEKLALESKYERAKFEALLHSPDVQVPVFTPKPIASTYETASSDTALEKSAQMFDKVLTEKDLPKSKIMTFDGTVLNYCRFISSFETYVEARVTDNMRRLQYLIDYCEGEAHELIGECVMYGEAGYAEARKLLLNRYGKPHIVARAYVDNLTRGPVIKNNDVNAMNQLATHMTRAKMGLSKIGYKSEIDNYDNLRRIVNRLPFHCKTRWIEKTDNILERGGEVTFNDLADFIEARARVAGSAFNVEPHSTSNVSSGNSGDKAHVKPKKETHSKGIVYTASAVSGKTQSDDKSSKPTKCVCCSGSCANLENCEQFKGLSLTDRKAMLYEYRMCYNCLIPGHNARKCYKKSKCNVEDCGRKHHALMHSWSRDEQVAESAQAQVQTVQAATCLTATTGPRKVALRIVPVQVMNGTRSVTTYALLDGGADHTLCDERLLTMLNLKSQKKSYSLDGVNTPKWHHGNEVDLRVKGIGCPDIVDIEGAWTQPKLRVSLRGLPNNADLKKWPHLADFTMPKVQADEVMLLIGEDVPEAQWSLGEVRGKKKEPYAVKSIFGWCIAGPINGGPKSRDVAQINFHQSCEEVLHQQLEKMWKTDFYDTQSNKKEMSLEDKAAYEVIEKTAVLSQGHYKMALPWRDDKVKLPKNQMLARTRLEYLKKKLVKDPTMRQKYTAQVEAYIQKGYAVRMTEEEASTETTKTWYLPHHGVTNPNKPGKLRVVFDCAAKYRDVSLNDMLLQGPDLVNNLVGVLMRFRQEQIAVMSDIEGMFNQVNVCAEDQDALRFLWWPDGDYSQEPAVYKMTVHIFGATSSPCCSTYALKKTATDNASQFSPATVTTVDKNFYVDDLLKSVDSKEDALNLVTELCTMLKLGGFRLTKWICNNKDVLAGIPDTEKSPAVVNLSLDDDLPVDRALGVKWNVEDDQFIFQVTQKTKPFTRRGILSVTAALYDPLGLVAPVTLFGKLLLQRLCRLELKWDDGIPSEDADSWCRWLDDLYALTTLKIPRCYQPADFGPRSSSTLHCFADASEYGYGACVYLRSVNADGKVSTALVVGKSRVAPVKPTTIPRLELAAAALATTLCDMVQQELEFVLETSVFWTDSEIVLAYIKNKKTRFKTFVANKLVTIHDSTEVEQWRHVPTADNPADLASRGVKADDSAKLEMWLTGPSFLSQDEANWPTKKIEDDETFIEMMEVKKERAFVYTVCATEHRIGMLAAHYSTWSRLMRAVVYWLRLKQMLKMKCRSRKLPAPTGFVTHDEMRQATHEVIRHVQACYFADEIKNLESGQPVLLSSPLSSHAPILEDGIIKVGGRLRRSKLKESRKHQVILPQRGDVTTLLARHFHQNNGHVGASHTLSLIRDEYWILNGLQACKSIVSKCIPCRRRNAVPMKQMMAELPEERLTPDKPPFSFVGSDYFGPFTVKIGRTHDKRYGVIFTCLTTRAVHLEVAHKMDTDSFLGAMSRFIARRGKPMKMFTDNGTNFKAGDKELRKMLSEWNQKQLNDAMIQRGIEWKFNPPSASHMGGMYERMIRSVRHVLKALMSEQIVHDEALLTVFAEAERVLNSRPICPVSTDSADPEVLTPAKLLLLQAHSDSLPPGLFNKDDCYARRWWPQAQYITELFWRRWLREYVPMLQIREKWQRPHRNVKPGDLVMMMEENTPRGQWPMAVVISVTKSRDKYVRSCRLRAGKTSLVRPIHKLCLLETAD